MATLTAWAAFALGVIHIMFGIVRFRGPLREAFSAGFMDQFRVTEERRTAFWFLACGPLLMLSGHVAIRAAETGDRELLEVVGVYALVLSAIGIAAFPKSPFWALLALSPLLIAAGNGYSW